MPMMRDRYPADWEEIAAGVKRRAGYTCAVCGRVCRKPGEPLDTHRRTLTVAHLNHDEADCRPSNLMAMCAPCHVRYDARSKGQARKGGAKAVDVEADMAAARAGVEKDRARLERICREYAAWHRRHGGGAIEWAVGQYARAAGVTKEEALAALEEYRKKEEMPDDEK